MNHFTRRNFLRNGIAAGAVVSTLPAWLLSCQSGQQNSAEEDMAETKKAASRRYFDHIGVQLYTLRDAFDANPEQTLKGIADIGYKEVELHDIGLLSSYAAQLADLGLTVTSSHFTSAYLTGQWEASGASRPADTSFESVLSMAAEHGLPYLVMPYLNADERGGLDRYKELAAAFNQHGEACKQADVQFCYHNHNFEFEPMEGTTPMEVLLAETDPELVAFELDIFWVKASGNDPASFLRKYPNRIKLLHLKDLKPGIAPTYNTEETGERHPDAFKEVGQGSIDFREVLTAAAEIGVTNCYVEQDQSPDPLASIATSYRYLEELGL